MYDKRNVTPVSLCKARRNSKLKYARVDVCIAPLVAVLNVFGIETLGACFGHGKYKPSIIIQAKGRKFELFSGKTILRKRRFYKRDKQGYYYIPECRK